MEITDKFRLAPLGIKPSEVKRGHSGPEGDTCLVAMENGEDKCHNAPALVWVVDQNGVIGTICFDCLLDHDPELADEAAKQE
jgi:hypothetical protein